MTDKIKATMKIILEIDGEEYVLTKEEAKVLHNNLSEMLDLRTRNFIPHIPAPLSDPLQPYQPYNPLRPYGDPPSKDSYPSRIQCEVLSGKSNN